MKFEYMKQALIIAENSGIDIPVGAVIVKEDNIIAKAVNTREKEQQTVNHAEILAIMQANKLLNNYRLKDCEMYVTLEPCPMCASAIIQSKISKVYFGAYDILNGALGSNCDMRRIMNAKLTVMGGIMEDECKNLIKNYFAGLR